MDGTECLIILDTGTTKSFMSKSYYFCCKSLRSLPKFASRTQRIQVGKGQFIVHNTNNSRHTWTFKIYILVSEIHENVDLVLGMKNIFELEGVINS